jgi:hypothetical protein
MKNDLELHVTLWPSFPFFGGTINDERVDGIRLNGPITFPIDRIDKDVGYAGYFDTSKLYFDVKSRQVRVVEAMPYKDHLELKVNHHIGIDKLPADVLFKDGTDYARVVEVKGDVLVFDGGPKREVQPCEPIYIRPPNYELLDSVISFYEAQRIAVAKKHGVTKFVQSYVESSRDSDELREHVGPDAEIIEKIESRRGLEYVANEFRKEDGNSLMLARGDLYVEVNLPHEIIGATKLLIDKDPETMVASRLLHSLRNANMPECADFSELEWLRGLGYKRYLLCDELCLEKNLIGLSINIFDAFRRYDGVYTPEKTSEKMPEVIPKVIPEKMPRIII